MKEYAVSDFPINEALQWRKKRLISHAFKRLFDILFSVIGILLLSPILLLTSVAVFISSGTPVLFKQVRVGRDTELFRVYKFRSMTVNAEKCGAQITIKNDTRITALGAFLRRTKLDELPQLFNVLAGKMSIVGPRPEVVKYVSLYNREQIKVLYMRPGITDTASIKYRNENDILATAKDPEQVYQEQVMPDKLKLNIEYIEGFSFYGDIKIILKTIMAVLKH